MLTWIEYWRMGDKAVLDVPDDKEDFILPPGTYEIQVNCICDAYCLAIVLQPIEDEGRYVRLRLPGMAGDPPQNCPPRRYAVCMRDGYRRQSYVPPTKRTELDRMDPSSWMAGIKHDTKYPSGTRKLDW